MPSLSLFRPLPLCNLVPDRAGDGRPPATGVLRGAAEEAVMTAV